MGVKAFHIGRIAVGEGNRPLVIPEIGINHGGSLTAAKEMADAAFRAGARLVKHQTHIVEDEMSRAARDVTPGNAGVHAVCGGAGDGIYQRALFARCRGPAGAVWREGVQDRVRGNEPLPPAPAYRGVWEAHAGVHRDE